jgi:ketosteroid isomerase-like protein
VRTRNVPRRLASIPVAVETVQRLYEAFEEGGIEAALEFIDPEFEAVIPPELSPEPDVYRGHEGVRRWFAGFEGMEHVRLEPKEFIEDGERVLVTGALRVRGAGSGIEVEQHAVPAWTLRGDKAVRVEVFPDLESARRAAR